MGRVLDFLDAVNIGRLVQRARRLDQASLDPRRDKSGAFPALGSYSVYFTFSRVTLKGSGATGVIGIGDCRGRFLDD